MGFEIGCKNTLFEIVFYVYLLPHEVYCIL